LQNQKIENMEKLKLIETRKKRGFSQEQMAFALNMDTSCYNRREKGQIKISSEHWQKIADVLDVPVEEIYQADETQFFICRDNASVHYQGTNNIYSIPESILDTQQKYIKKLEEENQHLKELLQKSLSTSKK